MTDDIASLVSFTLGVSPSCGGVFDCFSNIAFRISRAEKRNSDRLAYLYSLVPNVNPIP